MQGERVHFMNIVLIGYRGTGKSVVGKLLSKRLRRSLYSIDQMIVQSEGVTIPEIVEHQGWPVFREIETRMVAVAAEKNNAIIDCGGGVILKDQNTERLKKNGKMVWMTAEMETILQRIRKDPNRPPLKEGLSFEEEQKKVLMEREGRYRAAADYTCDTTEKKPQQSVREIIDHFKKMKWI